MNDDEEGAGGRGGRGVRASEAVAAATVTVVIGEDHTTSNTQPARFGLCLLHYSYCAPTQEMQMPITLSP